MDRSGFTELTDPDELRRLVGDVHPRIAGKVRDRLDPIDVNWLEESPFCLLATSNGEGHLDVSPKGDPPGFAKVLDERTIALPDRPGNRRVDGFFNVLADPHVGMLFIVPGRGDTLRVNGRGRLLTDAPFFADMVIKGHRPTLALLVDIDEVFYHCSKAFLRSALWKPETWNPDGPPQRARIAQALERPGDSIEKLQEYYGAQYEKHLYEA